MSYTHALGRAAELFQKVQHLETENADISHAYGVTRDVVKGLCEELANLKAENAALREENRKAHDMACEDAAERYRLNGENAVFRSLLIQAVLRYESPQSALTAKDYIARVKTALGEDKP